MSLIKIKQWHGGVEIFIPLIEGRGLIARIAFIIQQVTMKILRSFLGQLVLGGNFRWSCPLLGESEAVVLGLRSVLSVMAGV